MAKQKLKSIEEINEELQAKMDDLDKEIAPLSQLLSDEEYAFCKNIHQDFERECARIVPYCVKVYGKNHPKLEAYMMEAMRRIQIKHMEIELKYLKSIKHADN